MEWISVQYKLPEYNQRVLIFTNKDNGWNDIELGQYLKENKDSGINKDGFYIWNAGIEDYDIFVPSFWMPLPDQPERSKREDSQQCEMRCSEHCGNTVRDK